MNRKMHKIGNSEHGYSMLELIVVISVFGIIAGLAIGIISLNGQTIQRVYSKSLGRSELRKTLKIMRVDFQKLSSDSLLHTDSTQIAFYDLNNNYINYHMVGSLLLRNSQVLLRNVQETPFTYRDADYAVIQTGSTPVAYVQVNLVVNINGQVQRISDVFYVRN